MPLKTLDELKQKALNSYIDDLNKSFTSYKIFSGRIPKTCEDPDNGIILIEYKLPLNQTISNKATATGISEYFRIYINDKCVIQDLIEFRKSYKKDLEYNDLNPDGIKLIIIQ